MKMKVYNGKFLYGLLSNSSIYFQRFNPISAGVNPDVAEEYRDNRFRAFLGNRFTELYSKLNQKDKTIKL